MTDPTWDGYRWSDDDPITDKEKHAYCRRRRGVCATFISASLYASTCATSSSIKKSR